MILLVVIPMIIAGLWTGLVQSAGFDMLGPVHWTGFVMIGLFWGLVATVKALFE